MYLLNMLIAVLIFVTFQAVLAEKSCITPGGGRGECVFISDCPALLNTFSNPVSGAEEAIGKLRCGDNKHDLNVCCIKELSDKRYPQYCGLQHTDDYFRTGNTTGNTASIDEFPWLAALVGTDPNTGRKRIACHGSLINNRYILTAAQCFKSRFAMEFNISKVLLGKFLAEKETACVELAQYGIDECAESEEYGIEEKIIHPFFYIKNGLNDIALLRLNRDVSFTDYIRPICFPDEGTTFAKTGDVLYSTGWGDVNFNGPIATLKKKISTTLVPPQKCQISYPELTIMSTYHICTLDSASNSEFSCTGDVGAPVMFSHKKQFHVEGILSKGKGCGATFPGVHTKVSNYLNWVRQNIRP